MSVRLLALALLLPATAVPPASATGADTVNGTGRKCAFNSVSDLTAEQGTQIGATSAGPLVFTMGGGVLRCEIYVNGTVAVSVAVHTTDAGGVDTVTVPPAQITFHSNVTDVVVECTVMTYDSGPYAGRTQFWQPATAPRLGAWADGPVNSSNCAVTSGGPPEPEACPVLLTIDKYAGTPLAAIWQDCEDSEPIV